MSFFTKTPKVDDEHAREAERLESKKKDEEYQQKLAEHAAEVQKLEAKYVAEMATSTTVLDTLQTALSDDNCLENRKALLAEVLKWRSRGVRNVMEFYGGQFFVYSRHYFPSPPFNRDMFSPLSFEYIVPPDGDYAKASREFSKVVFRAEGVLVASYGPLAKNFLVASEEADAETREVVLVQHTMTGVIRKYWTTLNGVQSVSVVFVPHYRLKG